MGRSHGVSAHPATRCRRSFECHSPTCPVAMFAAGTRMSTGLIRHPALLASFDYTVGRNGKRLAVSENIDGVTAELEDKMERQRE